MHTKTLRRALILFCLVVPSALLRANPALPAVPSSLTVPADQESALVLTARGVQIYECRVQSFNPEKHAWVLKAPEAELFDTQGRKAGRHSAGPTWESTDGSKVVGRVEGTANAPDGKGVPWLRLEATSNTGVGVMSKVRSIQRINTVGGQAPTEAADESKAGQERRVDYTATYVFYVAKP